MAQNVLFIGNSLSYSNELPEMLKALGKVTKKKIKVQCHCFPSYGLEDHWNDGLIQGMIENNDFDYVIFQQGPSSQAYGRASLIEYGGKISALARKHHAIPVYFMVWPSLQYYHTFSGVVKNHGDAAKENKATLAPIGSIWRKYRLENGLVDLYGADGFHPSPAGTFLAAMILLKTIFPETDFTQLNYKKYKTLFDQKSFDKMIVMVMEDGNN